VKPPPLVPGRSTIAVVAPAGPPRSLPALRLGCERIEARGFRVVKPAERAAVRYLAGSDDARTDEFNRALRDPDIDALFCVRGGYGTMRLLPRIDYAALRAHPKLIVGYSDITALQLAVICHAGVPSVSGPMVGVDWPALPGPAEAQFWALASGAIPPLCGDTDALVPIRTGVAEGPLLGGTLSLIARLLGTPYLPALEGSILFLEDVGEAPYRIDAMFSQLRLAGVLDRLAGVVFGAFTEFPKADEDEADFRNLVEECFAGAPYPVARGLKYGHFTDKLAVPIGVQARLDVGPSHAALSLCESVVKASSYTVG
jgi:muramoyltetrapeptide carboxypeptidase